MIKIDEKDLLDDIFGTVARADISSFDETWRYAVYVDGALWGNLAEWLVDWLHRQLGPAPWALSEHQLSRLFGWPMRNDVRAFAVLDSMPDVTKHVWLPCECAIDKAVWTAVTHLNDEHRWSRDDIADWLDTLDIDLTFRKTKYIV